MPDAKPVLHWRKKPVVVTAEQMTERREIETLEGRMRCDPSDWLITGVEGEHYFCKDSIFRKTYELVVEGNPKPARLSMETLVIAQRFVTEHLTTERVYYREEGMLLLRRACRYMQRLLAHAEALAEHNARLREALAVEVGGEIDRAIAFVGDAPLQRAEAERDAALRAGDDLVRWAGGFTDGDYDSVTVMDELREAVMRWRALRKDGNLPACPYCPQYKSECYEADEQRDAARAEAREVGARLDAATSAVRLPHRGRFVQLVETLVEMDYQRHKMGALRLRVALDLSARHDAEKKLKTARVEAETLRAALERIASTGDCQPGLEWEVAEAALREKDARDG